MCVILRAKQLSDRRRIRDQRPPVLLEIPIRGRTITDVQLSWYKTEARLNGERWREEGREKRVKRERRDEREALSNLM